MVVEHFSRTVRWEKLLEEMGTGSISLRGMPTKEHHPNILLRLPWSTNLKTRGVRSVTNTGWARNKVWDDVG